MVRVTPKRLKARALNLKQLKFDSRFKIGSTFGGQSAIGNVMSNFYFPSKPKEEDEFRKPVSWLGGREFISSLKGMILFTVFKGKIDPRSWMKAELYPKLIRGDGETTEAFETRISNLWLRRVNQAWAWKKKYFAAWSDYIARHGEFWKEKTQDGQEELKEFWFDFISDTGDGQISVYNIGCLFFSDLWIVDESGEKKIKFKGDANTSPDNLLPRGSFLFIGGDTAYHVADYATLHERFQNPVRWAFASVRKFLSKHYELKTNVPQTNLKGFGVERDDDRNIIREGEHWENWDGMFYEKHNWDTEPLRPIFAVPANHDYYDDIDGFNRQFRRSPLLQRENKIMEDDGPPLVIPSFERKQEASYLALQLPFGWSLWGVDSEIDKVDFRQRQFFTQFAKNALPKKLIIATPEPTTVFGKRCDDDDKTAIAYSTLGLEQTFLRDGKLNGDVLCRLDLSGDVHHYARYWGENTSNLKTEFSSENYASVVAGGGGAFFHPSHTFAGENEDANGNKVDGEIPPQKIYPEPNNSREAVAKRIFDLRNIREGGYVQTIGAALAGIIFFAATFPPTVYDYARKLFADHIPALFKNDLRPSYLYPEFITSPTQPSLYSFVSICLMLLAVILIAVSLYQLYGLVKQLREKRLYNIEGKKFETRKEKTEYENRQMVELSRLSALTGVVLCFLLGVIAYIVFLIYLLTTKLVLNEMGTQAGPSALHPFEQSIMLLLHLVGAGLLVGLSAVYGNWLNYRFKYVGKIEAMREMGTDANEQSLSGKIASRLAHLPKTHIARFDSIREGFSETLNVFRYIPVWIINLCAVALLVAGILLFGKQPLSFIFTDIIFVLVILGSLVGLVAFAVSSGGVMKKGLSKYLGFGALGFFHALFQLLTPFFLIKVGGWVVILFMLVAVIVFNGSSRLSIHSIGERLMRKGKTLALTIMWFVYGGAAIFLPFLFSQQKGYTSIENFIHGWLAIPSRFLVSFLPQGLAQWLTKDVTQEWILTIIALLAAIYLGYRLTRAWFSWYLAVALAYNGHNNEAGGAARIEGFKQMLRIKLTKDEMTVFVIGFDQAASDIENLQPKLIEQFTLKCKKNP
jgi:hypothetical protein